MNLADLIKSRVDAYRIANGDGMNAMPIAEVARRIGVSRETMSGWLNGSVTPSLSNAVSIADTLGISLDELAGRTPAAR